MAKCTAPVETYSRVVGYYRPVQQWNDAKREEFKNRKLFDLKKFDSATEDKKNGVTKD